MHISHQNFPNHDQSSFTIRITDTDEGRSCASLLIKTMYARRGYTCKHQIENNENQVTLSAYKEETLIGTITLGIDSPGGILADEAFRDQIDLFRHAGAKVCEVTKLALDWTGSSHRALASMFHTLFIYARYVHHRTHFFIEVNPRHQRYYRTMLGFKLQCEPRESSRVKAPACLLWLDLDEIAKKIDKFGRSSNPNKGERSLFRYGFSPEEEAGIVERILKYG